MSNTQKSYIFPLVKALKIFGFVFILLIISVLIVFKYQAYMSADEAPVTASEAPLNPLFANYFNKIMQSSDPSGANRATDPECPNCKLIPEPIDFSYLSSPQIMQSPGGILQSSFPASYDLRATGKLTMVKNQLQCGSCWAHAAIGSLESSIMPTKLNDYSENNMKNKTGYTISCCNGGNRLMANAYLARQGSVDESVDPYNIDCNSSPSTAKPSGIIQDVTYLPVRTGPLDNDTLKQAMMTHGAVYTTYFHHTAFLNPKNYAYNNTGATRANHAVDIVGWDDNYSRNNFLSVPAGDGAFIIKNSWGASWGQNGYFYLSYYDTQLGKEENAVFFSSPTTNYSNIYQYDDLGWTSSIGSSSGQTSSFANIFTAKSEDKISAAAWYTAAPNASYELSVYKNVGSDPTTGATLLTTQSGVVQAAGYHTVIINNPVTVSSGQKFSVVVKLLTPSYPYPIPLERPYQYYSDAATANPGEGFIKYSETSPWADLVKTYVNSSIALKAFGSKTATPPKEGKIEVTPQTSQNFSGPLGGPFSPVKQTYTISNTGTKPVNWAINKIQSWLNVSQSSGTLNADSNINIDVSILASANTLSIGKYTDTIVFTNMVSNINNTSRLINLEVTKIGDKIAPSVPQNLHMVAVTGTSVSLAWSPSTDNIAVAGYKVYRAGAQIADISQPSYIDNNVKPATGYSYTVSTYDSSNNLSGPSVALVVTTNTTKPPLDTIAPTIPINVASPSQGTSSISLTWNASTDNIGVTNYRVLRNGIIVGTPSSPNFTDTGLNSGTSYTYHINAWDSVGNGSAYSTPLVATTSKIDLKDVTAPTVPGNLSEINKTTSSISFSWSASIDNVGVIGYYIYRGNIFIADTKTTSFTDDNLKSDTSYTYSISAYDAAGNYSSKSNQLAMKTLKITLPDPDTNPPSSPNNLKSTGVTINAISLAWDASTDNVGVAGYNIYRNSKLINTAQSTSYTDSGLLSNFSYNYQISAFDKAGNYSPLSTSVRARTDISSRTTVTLSGKIYQTGSQNLIAGATVYLKGVDTNNSYTINAASGQFYKTTIPVGTYTLKVAADYYLDYLERSFVVNSDNNIINKKIEMVQGVAVNGLIRNAKNLHSVAAKIEVFNNNVLVASTTNTLSDKGVFAIRQNIAKKTNYQIKATARGYNTKTVQLNTAGASKVNNIYTSDVNIYIQPIGTYQQIKNTFSSLFSQ